MEESTKKYMETSRSCNLQLGTRLQNIAKVEAIYS